MKKVVFPTGQFISPGQRTIRVESFEEIEGELVKTEEFVDITIPIPKGENTNFTFEDKSWTIVIDSDENFWGLGGKEGCVARIEQKNKEDLKNLSEMFEWRSDEKITTAKKQFDNIVAIAQKNRFLLDQDGLPIGPPITFSKSRLETEHKTTMAHIMAELKLFPSVSQAKKNGWDKPIELGEHIVTKKKIRFNVIL